METTLIVPGLYGSGPVHWQTWFETQIDGSRRVTQDDWTRPDLGVWAEQVKRAVEAAGGPVWLVAHSFGCLASVAAAQGCGDAIAGALLVAPADPERFALGGHIPDQALPFPSIVVASTNDPWVRLMTAGYWAHRWNSHLVNLGAAGHINTDAGFGPWPEGLAIFEALRRGDPVTSVSSRAPARQPAVERPVHCSGV